MKNKILVISILVMAFVLTGSVYAVNTNNGMEVGNQNRQQTQTANQGEDSQIKAQNNEQAQNNNNEENLTQNQNKNQEQNKEQGQINAEQHRSSVSNFVQKLLQVADREGGIGEQVRTIAQQQNQSTDAVVQAMEKVQTRSRFKTFLIGTDYKNLGALRSETVQTRNRLEQLNKLMENVQNEGDKNELQNQIQTLEQEQTKIENFIKNNENKFSLFGWFAKLFNR